MAAGKQLHPTRWPHLSSHTWAACAFSYRWETVGWAQLPATQAPGNGTSSHDSWSSLHKAPWAPTRGWGDRDSTFYQVSAHWEASSHRGGKGEAVLLLCIHVWSLGTHSAPSLQLCPLCQHLPQLPTAPPQLLITHEHGLRGPQPPSLCPGARTERRRWGQKGLQADSSSAAQRALGDSRQGVDWGEVASCFRSPSLSWGSQFIGLDRLTGSPWLQ